MKNIHVLPTDEPTRIHNTFNILRLETGFELSPCNLNLYITSDEKPKQNEWYIYTDILSKLHIRLFSDEGIRKGDDGKKIILTSDRDLINFGIQSLDDDFVKWFIKNPNCEEVEVVKENICARCYSNDVDDCWSAKVCSDGKYDKIKYKIIIPIETPINPNNQEVMFHEERQEYFYEDIINDKHLIVWLSKDYSPKEQSKQEEFENVSFGEERIKLPVQEETIDDATQTEIYQTINNIIDGGKDLPIGYNVTRSQAIDYAFSIALKIAEWQNKNVKRNTPKM